MKIFLDDVRECPAGWTIARNVDTFIHYLDKYKGEVEAISFDHDMGAEDYKGGSGYTAIVELERRVVMEDYPKIPTVYIHTSNPSVLQKMFDAADKVAYTVYRS